MEQAIAVRFWNKVNKTNSCWLWTGATANGYGRIKINRRVFSTHRVSWELHFGPIPKNLCVLHYCDTRNCVRPDHLFTGTYTDNVRDMMVKGRYGRPGAKLDEAKVIKIRKVSSKLRPEKSADCIYAFLAKKYGVSPFTIQRAVNGGSWRHVKG